MDENGILQTGWFSIKGNNFKGEEYEKHYYAQLDGRVLKGGIHEYSCVMKSHFWKFGNQMFGSGNHLCEFTRIMFYLDRIPHAWIYHVQYQCLRY